MTATIDLSRLSRSQLKVLADDVSTALEMRETEDRAALEENLRSLVEDAGFDPDDVRFAKNGGRKAKVKTHRKNGEDHV